MGRLAPRARRFRVVAGDTPRFVEIPESFDVALKFVADGNTYFGWARITLNAGLPTITGYAYESAPGQSIKAGVMGGPEEKSDASQVPALPAPQPATLGALACGASGLALWRRPEEMN